MHACAYAVAVATNIRVPRNHAGNRATSPPAQPTPGFVRSSSSSRARAPHREHGRSGSSMRSRCGPGPMFRTHLFLSLLSRRRGGQRSPLVPVAPRGPAGATAPGLLTCRERASGIQIMQPPAGGAGRRAAGQDSGLAKRLCLAGVATAREVARRSICAARPASEIPRAGRGGQVTRRRPPQEKRARGSGRGQSGVGNRRARAAVRCP